MIRRAGTQISLTIVCMILGFVLAYQFKSTLTSTTVVKRADFINISRQINDLNKQKAELGVKIKEYQKKVNSYEKSAAGQSGAVKALSNDLSRFHELAGLTDVVGEGLVITITPTEDIFSRETLPLASDELILIINDLNSGGAEAVSVNDERYVASTKIINDKNYIKINNSEFDGTKPFIIKAIGNPDTLNKILKLPDNILNDIKETGTQVSIKQAGDIKILKYNQGLEYKYMKSIND